MNSSPKTPPRFVPTLTEIVPVDVAKDEAIEDSSSLMPAQAECSQRAPDAAAVDPLVIAAAPLAPFHSPWLADGLYVRGLPAAIPHDLPPLPESLPPQQPFADLSVAFQDNPVQGVDSLSEQHGPEPVQSESTAQAGLDVAELAVEVEAAAEQPELDMQEQMLNQLMRHVEQVLDERLQAVIATVIEEQTQSLAQRLREEMKSVVQQTLEQAGGTAAASQKA
ncbi:MAG: hypothetical protein LBE30_03095 [Comamonas sp.]|jgi:hypothetical protein|nr:hypothetical protein [Comamonas sp.]